MKVLFKGTYSKLQIFAIVKWLRHYPPTVKVGVQIPIAVKFSALFSLLENGDIGESYNG